MADEVQLIGPTGDHVWFQCRPMILFPDGDAAGRAPEYSNIMLREVLATFSDAHRNRFHQGLCEHSRAPEARAIMALVTAQTVRMLDRAS